MSTPAFPQHYSVADIESAIGQGTLERGAHPHDLSRINYPVTIDGKTVVVTGRKLIGMLDARDLEPRVIGAIVRTRGLTLTDKEISSVIAAGGGEPLKPRETTNRAYHGVWKRSPK